MRTISNGHRADYLTIAVAAGRENYDTRAVAAGEPPGRWYGRRGAETQGLAGEVDAQDMTALCERLIDPRDQTSATPSGGPDAATLGHAGRQYRSEDEIYAAALGAEPDPGVERRAELRIEVGQKARKYVAFPDATFSVEKSITVLHAAFKPKRFAPVLLPRTPAVHSQTRPVVTAWVLPFLVHPLRCTGNPVP